MSFHYGRPARTTKNAEPPICGNCGKRMFQSDQKRKGVIRWKCVTPDNRICSRTKTEHENVPWHRGGNHSLLPSRDKLAELIQTLTYKQIAAKYGCSEKTVADAVRRHQLRSAPGGAKIAKIGPETVASVIRDYLAGKLSLRRIADKHQISYGAATDIIYRRGPNREAIAQAVLSESCTEKAKFPESMSMGRPFGGSGWHSWGGVFAARAGE